MLLRIPSAGFGSSHLLKNTLNPPHFLHGFSPPPETACAQPAALALWVAAGVAVAACWGRTGSAPALILLYKPLAINKHTPLLSYLSSFCLSYALVAGMGYDYSCHADCRDLGLFMPG